MSACHGWFLSYNVEDGSDGLRTFPGVYAPPQRLDGTQDRRTPDWRKRRRRPNEGRASPALSPALGPWKITKKGIAAIRYAWTWIGIFIG